MPNFSRDEIEAFKVWYVGNPAHSQEAGADVNSKHTFKVDGKDCQKFTHAYHYDSKDDEVYKHVEEEDGTVTKHLVLANDDPVDHQQAKIVVIDELSALDPIDDKKKFRAIFNTDLTKEGNAKTFKKLVREALEPHFEFGTGFLGTWNFVTLQEQIRVWHKCRRGGRATPGDNRVLILRQEELIRTLLCRPGVTASEASKKAFIDEMAKVNERADILDAQMKEVHKRLDEHGNLIDKLRADVGADLDQIREAVGMRGGGLVTGGGTGTAVGYATAVSAAPAVGAGLAASSSATTEDSDLWDHGGILNFQLLDEHRDIVLSAADGPSEDQVAGFVTKGHIRSLLSDEWLNDTVLNSFIRSLLRPDCLFLNSFFLSKLLEDDKLDFAKVKKWVKVKVFDGRYSKIVIPINKGNAHWAVAIVDLNKKEIKGYDSLRHGCRSPFLKAILAWLKEVHMDETKNPLPAAWCCIDTTLDPSIPRQLNGYDCGVFVCLYAYFMSAGLPLDFDQDKITDREVRMKIALSLLKDHRL